MVAFRNYMSVFIQLYMQLSTEMTSIHLLIVSVRLYVFVQVRCHFDHIHILGLYESIIHYIHANWAIYYVYFFFFLMSRFSSDPSGTSNITLMRNAARNVTIVCPKKR